MFPDIYVAEDRLVARLEVMPGLESAFSLGDEEELLRKPKRMPSAAVLVEDVELGESDTIASISQDGLMRWQVILMAQSFKGPRDNRASGMYGLLMAAYDWLTGYEILDGHPMWIESIRPIALPLAQSAGMRLILAHQFDAQEA